MFKKKKIKKIEICIQKSLHFFFYCEYHLELNEHIFLGSFWKYVCALYFNRCNRIKLSFDFVKTKPTSENPATLCWHIVSFIWNLWIIIVCNNKGKKIRVRLGGRDFIFCETLGACSPYYCTSLPVQKCIQHYELHVWATADLPVVVWK